MNKTEISFLKRHIGLNSADIDEMLNIMKFNSIDELIEKVIPKDIYSRLDHNLIEKNLSETEVLDKLKKYSNNNLIFKSFIGMGYHGTIVPNVIKRNIFVDSLPHWLVSACFIPTFTPGELVFKDCYGSQKTKRRNGIPG